RSGRRGGSCSPSRGGGGGCRRPRAGGAPDTTGAPWCGRCFGCTRRRSRPIPVRSPLTSPWRDDHSTDPAGARRGVGGGVRTLVGGHGEPVGPVARAYGRRVGRPRRGARPQVRGGPDGGGECAATPRGKGAACRSRCGRVRAEGGA